MGENHRWYDWWWGNLIQTDQLWCQKIIEHRQMDWVKSNLSPLIRNLSLEYMIDYGLYDKAEVDMAYPLQNIMGYSAVLGSRLYSAHRGLEEKVFPSFSPLFVEG